MGGKIPSAFFQLPEKTNDIFNLYRESKAISYERVSGRMISIAKVLKI